jgi:hypothetical protein
VAGDLTAAVQHQDRAVTLDREAGGRRVRHVVRHEPHLVRVEPGQRGGEELGRPARVVDPQVVPRIAQAEAGRVPAQARVERVRHRVQIAGGEAGRLQAPGGRQLGQLPRGERDRPLAVLAPAEPFLLRGRDHLTVNDQRRRRIMEDRVDTQNSHGEALTLVVAHLFA